jgi:16S rRNA (guanine(966)-N(2))-methyltransferase RsmD
MSSLRVISGVAGGHRLKAVPGDSTRPITDRTKEALFNIIRQDLPGGSLLDLFGGTGAVGIEALSRGAAYVRFMDRERAAIQTIHQNLEHTGLAAGAEVMQGDAFALLRRGPDQAFDYVYIAPPQYKGMWKLALEVLDENAGWLVEDAWVIAQIHPKEYEALDLTHLAEFDQRKYGNTLLVFYERVEESET